MTDSTTPTTSNEIGFAHSEFLREIANGVAGSTSVFSLAVILYFLRPTLAAVLGEINASLSCSAIFLIASPILYRWRKRQRDSKDAEALVAALKAEGINLTSERRKEK